MKETMQKIFKRVGIILIILLVITIVYTISAKWLIRYMISSDREAAAVSIYNYQIYRGLWDSKCQQMFKDDIASKVDEFLCDDDLPKDDYFDDYTKKYNRIKNTLVQIEKIDCDKVSKLAHTKIEFITIEYNGRLDYIKAEEEYKKHDYIKCLHIISKIDKRYSLNDSVQELYFDCIFEILNSVSNPNSVKEYEDSIHMLNNCINIIEEKQFITRKQELEDELAVFRKVVSYIERAESYVQQKDYINAVRVLSEPSKHYPNEKHLALALEDCQSYLVIYTSEKVNELVKEKRYKEALTLIEKAQEVYDSADLSILCADVKKISSPLYRIKTMIANKTTAILSYFKKDIANVKQEGGIAYVYRSGEKVLLGNYSKKDVSVLSVAGSGLLSLAGLDVPLDLRDFAYDIQHIGEDDDWVVWLAVDTVAILPVIGTVKYLKYAETTGKITDDAIDTAKCIDKIEDSNKSARKISYAINGVDAISDIGKIKTRFIELKDTKLGNVVKIQKSVKHYEYIDTYNSGLLGSKYKETGVKFVLSKIKLSNGDLIKGVFPKFHYKFQYKLSQDLFQATDAKQYAACNKQLKKAVEHNPFLKKKFTQEQLGQIEKGVNPAGYTWHHNEQEGVMQLVDSEVHNKVKHTGGKKIWGGGTAAR